VGLNSAERLQEAEQALFQIFSGIGATVKQNLKRVLNAFRHHRVGVHHFAGVTGYGHDDLGRETFDQVFAEIVGAEAAAVRVQFVSGTHAIACALFGNLRPGDEMLAVAGAPYDTLEEVIGLRGKGQGSLIEFGISYRELPLSKDGSVDWEALKSAVTDRTRLVLIQRSCGYSWRASLSISEIDKLARQE
jgi:cystathionine beta-lyase family protein involved in aluminum resistance